MSFLKRIFTQYIEKRTFCREYEAFAKNLEKVTNTKYEILKQMYSCDVLPLDIGMAEQYPAYVFPSKFDLYASMYSFPASNEDTELFESLVNSNFSYSENKVYTRMNDKGQTESLHLNIRSIFSIKEIEVCTNSSTFIEVIKKTHIQCPPPWLAFPKLTLAEFHPSQGETGHYNQFFWDPFWLRLDKNAKKQYYATESIPKEWEEHMRFLDELRELD